MKTPTCNTLVIFVSLFMGTLILFSFISIDSQDMTLSLNFSGLDKDDESKIMIAVYHNSETFLGDNPIKTFKVATNGKQALSHQIDLPEGDYGIAFFQDLNGNEKLDKNFVGYPTEPFAFSNNAPANFGPPKWSDAVFNIGKQMSMDIKF